MVRKMVVMVMVNVVVVVMMMMMRRRRTSLNSVNRKRGWRERLKYGPRLLAPRLLSASHNLAGAGARRCWAMAAGEAPQYTIK